MSSVCVCGGGGGGCVFFFVFFYINLSSAGMKVTL